MSIFRKKKTEPLSFHDATCMAVANCTKSTSADHCMISSDGLAYICGLHYPAAVQAGMVEEIVR